MPKPLYMLVDVVEEGQYSEERAVHFSTLSGTKVCGLTEESNVYTSSTGKLYVRCMSVLSYDFFNEVVLVEPYVTTANGKRCWEVHRDQLVWEEDLK